MQTSAEPIIPGNSFRLSGMFHIFASGDIK